MINQSGIYEIVNTVNGKRYIGSAVNLDARWRVHKHQARKGKHHSLSFQRAWNKYGEQAFVFKPLLICARDAGILKMYEQACFTAYRPEYNIAPVAGSQLGLKRTAEQRAGMSKAQKGTKKGPFSAEHCERLSAFQRGRKLSPEWCANIAAAQRGKKRGPPSAETRALLSASAIARGIPAATRAAAIQASLGNKFAAGKRTPAQIENMKAGRRAAQLKKEINPC